MTAVMSETFLMNGTTVTTVMIDLFDCSEPVTATMMVKAGL